MTSPSVRLCYVRQELRASSRLLREQARARRLPEARRTRARRWTRRGLLLLLLLLCVFLRECRCTPDPALRGSAPPPAIRFPVPSIKKPPPVRAKSTPPAQRRGRARYEITPPAPQLWMEALRVQVVARTLRLSACFVGVEKPGALRWSAWLDAVTGVASDHAFHSAENQNPLTAVQEACLVEVLSTPPYRLGVARGDSPPGRVSLLIEF